MKSTLVSTIALALVALAGCSNSPSSSGPATPASQDATEKRAPAPAAAPAAAGVLKIGEAAPDFELTDLDGKAHKLSAYKGKVVVLEWFNPGCPFVKKNHAGGQLKEQAKRAMANGVVWLSINSSAEGKEGHGRDTNAKAKADWAMPNPVLLDESGKVGKQYGAKTTPHMYVVDKDGKLAYQGAIDNDPDVGDPRGDKVENYVDLALADLAAGRAVAKPEVKPYGCSVKYAQR